VGFTYCVLLYALLISSLDTVYILAYLTENFSNCAQGDDSVTDCIYDQVSGIVNVHMSWNAREDNFVLNDVRETHSTHCL